MSATGTGGALGFDLSTRPYIPPLQAGADTVWSGGIMGVQTGETTVAYGRTVRGPDGVARGFLIAAFYPQQLAENLPVSLPADARVTILDQNGGLHYHSDASESATEASGSAGVQAALAGKLVRVVGPAAPIPGDARFGALVPTDRLGWVVGYTRPLGPSA